MALITEEHISARIRELMEKSQELNGGAFGDALHICFRGYDAERREFLFSARTERWMRNIDGVVHGGFCHVQIDPPVCGSLLYAETGKCLF